MATLPPLPAADVSLKAGDILENLDAAFMALVELRKGRWGAFGDIIYSSLSSEADPPLGLLYSNPELECTNLILTLAGTYRPISGPNGFLDIVVGGRYWSVDTHFEL